MAAVSVEQTVCVSIWVCVGWVVSSSCHFVIVIFRRIVLNPRRAQSHTRTLIFLSLVTANWWTGRTKRRQRDKTLPTETFLMSDMSDGGLVKRKDPCWVPDRLCETNSDLWPLGHRFQLFKTPFNKLNCAIKTVDFPPPEFITSISLPSRRKIDTNFSWSYFEVQQCTDACCIFGGGDYPF